MEDITQSDIWSGLSDQYEALKSKTLNDLFRDNPERADQYFLKLDDICLDYSKNHLDENVMNSLLGLADEVALQDQIAALFEGEEVNNTEQRAALHTALRDPGDANYPEIKETLARMSKLSSEVIEGKRTGYSGKPFNQIIHIGIGGSYLGPRMLDEALNASLKRKIPCDFLANIDANHVNAILEKTDPETTLVIVASKTFATLETLVNAKAVKEYFQQAVPAIDPGQHFVAVTANTELASDFGINPGNIFPCWDFVGGRYSLWSAMGLPISVSYGHKVFEELLAGAHRMDCHFRTASLDRNMPVILALLSLWYRNFFKAASHAVIPYDHYLRLLPAHLQQLIMESNGKSVKKDGSEVSLETSPVIWGGEGTNGQHAFHQLLHQGTGMITLDFILPLSGKHHRKAYQDQMVANCLAQAQALMLGRSAEAIVEKLISSGMGEETALALAKHQSSPGNRPSNMLLLDRLTAGSLGALVALYEHKVFCEAMLWQINPFDQWGVELGKSLGGKLYDQIQSGKPEAELDASTRHLLEIYRSVR